MYYTILYYINLYHTILTYIIPCITMPWAMICLASCLKIRMPRRWRQCTCWEGGLLSASSILIQSTTGELEAVSTKIRTHLDHLDSFGIFGECDQSFDIIWSYSMDLQAWHWVDDGWMKYICPHTRTHTRTHTHAHTHTHIKNNIIMYTIYIDAPRHHYAPYVEMWFGWRYRRWPVQFCGYNGLNEGFHADGCAGYPWAPKLLLSDVKAWYGGFAGPSFSNTWCYRPCLPKIFWYLVQSFRYFHISCLCFRQEKAAAGSMRSADPVPWWCHVWWTGLGWRCSTHFEPV